MKKLFLFAAAAMLSMAAAAQNKAIDRLVEKYTDREGFTVINLQGDMLRSMGGMINRGESSIEVDGKRYEIAELLKDIVSVNVVVLQRADEIFSRDVRDAIDAVRYSPILSISEGGQKVKVSSADIRRGTLRGNQEIVLMVDGGGQTVMARVIGKIDTRLISEIVNQAQKEDRL
jgi:hypothetical protein